MRTWTPTGWAVAAAVAALLWLAGEAPAAEVDRGEVALYLAIAEDYWQAPALDVDVTYAPAPGHEHAFAAAELDGRRIWVNPAYWGRTPRAWRCDKIAHEVGHILGIPHPPPAPLGVYQGPMDSFRERVIPGCRRPMKGRVVVLERLARRAGR